MFTHTFHTSCVLQKGFTPLHIAAKYGNIKVVQLLLQKEADPNVQGKNGLTPLHVATHYNHVNVALLLLENGASPHCTAKVSQFFHLLILFTLFPIPQLIPHFCK